MALIKLEGNWGVPGFGEVRREFGGPGLGGLAQGLSGFDY